MSDRAVPGRVGRAVVPLQEPLGVRVGPVHLGGRRGGQEEDLGGDLLGLQDALDGLGAVLPERGGLRLVQVADDQPVELRQRPALIAGVLAAHGRVLAHRHQALDLPLGHVHEHRHVRVVPHDLREPAVAVIVLLRGRLAEPRLEQADHEFGEVDPVARRADLGGDVIRQRVVLLQRARHVEIAGQEVVERGDVGRPLDRRVPAEREDAAPRPADVAEQQLQDRRRADGLHAGRVLGPADRVADHRRPVGPRGRHQRLCDFQERLDGRPADPLDHLGRIAGVMPAKDLEDAARVLQRRVGPRRLGQLACPGAERLRVVLDGLRLVLGLLPRLGVVPPALRVVGAVVGVEAREEAFEVLGVLVILGDERRGVGVGDHVVPEVGVILEDVADQAAEEDDVGAGARGA